MPRDFRSALVVLNPHAIYRPSNQMENEQCDGEQRLRASIESTRQRKDYRQPRLHRSGTRGPHGPRRLLRQSRRFHQDCRAQSARKAGRRGSPIRGTQAARRQDLEVARDGGIPLHIQVLGLASIASDVTPELARAAIAYVQVLGAFQASPAVKAALADRIG
jgi:Ribbon-Helix-Helix transcriptional regulator family